MSDGMVYLMVKGAAGNGSIEHAFEVASNRFKWGGLACGHLELLGSRVMVVSDCSEEQALMLASASGTAVLVLDSASELLDLALTNYNGKNEEKYAWMHASCPSRPDIITVARNEHIRKKEADLRAFGSLVEEIKKFKKRNKGN